MWIFEAIAQTPFKRPFLLLTITLGAAFLLLARLTSSDPLFHPAIFGILGLDFHFLFSRNNTLARALIIAAASSLLAYFCHPRYELVFCGAFSLLIGKMIFSDSFRLWKWLLSSILLYASIPMISIWQQLLAANQFVPAFVLPAMYGTILAFCAQFSLTIYALRKNHVQRAIDEYHWLAKSEPATMAMQTKDLY